MDLYTQDTVDVESIWSNERDNLSVKSVSDRENIVNSISADAITRSTETEIAVAGAYDESLVYSAGYTSGATSSSGSIRVNSGWHSLGYVYIGTSIPSHIVA